MNTVLEAVTTSIKIYFAIANVFRSTYKPRLTMMIRSEEVIAVIKRQFPAIICMVMILPSWAVADADGEREVLARLQQELQAVEALVLEAEQQADLTQKSTFAYHDLRRDLAAVQTGIQEYVAGSRRMPRVVEPLTGTYQR